MRIFSTFNWIYSIVRLEKYVQNRKFNGNVNKGAKGVRRSFYAKTSKFGHSQFNFDLRLYDMKRLSMDSRNHPIFSLIFVQATMALHIFLELWINGHLMVFECNSQLVPLSWSMWSKRDSFPVLSFSIFFFFHLILLHIETIEYFQHKSMKKTSSIGGHSGQRLHMETNIVHHLLKYGCMAAMYYVFE